MRAKLDPELQMTIDEFLASPDPVPACLSSKFPYKAATPAPAEG